MRFSCLLTFLMVSLSLAACQGSATETRRYVPPEKAGGRMCVFSCRQAKDSCLQNCGLEERACTNEMQAEAIQAYESYAQTQLHEHKPLTRFPRDFEKPEKCVALRCRGSCDNDYDACYESCGGQVVIQSSCQALCF